MGILGGDVDIIMWDIYYIVIINLVVENIQHTLSFILIKFGKSTYNFCLMTK